LPFSFLKRASHSREKKKKEKKKKEEKEKEKKKRQNEPWRSFSSKSCPANQLPVFLLK